MAILRLTENGRTADHNYTGIILFGGLIKKPAAAWFS